MSVLVVVLIVLLALFATGAGLRWRKLRRDRRRLQPLTTLPPEVNVAPRTSGFRIVGEGYEPRSATPRTPPRLDASRPYVFGENSELDGFSSTGANKSDRWALQRSGSRSRFSVANVKLVSAVVATLVVLAVAGAVVQHELGSSTQRRPHAHVTTSTTSSTTTTSSSTTTVPTPAG